MSVVAAAICPHPPIVVPGIAGAAAGELDPLRLAADEAVAALLAAAAEVLVVVGTGPRTEWFDGDCAGSFAPWGLDLRVGSPAAGDPRLPLSLTIGRWLLDRAGFGRPSGFQAIGNRASAGECRRIGESVAASARRVSLLVMGDGSARRGPDSPGTPHPLARSFDEGVAAALAAGDPAALLALSPALADELLVAGRPAWQVLAAAMSGSVAGGAASGSVAGGAASGSVAGGAASGHAGGGAREVAAIRARLRYAAAPYGVGYFVASWGVR